MPKVSLWTLNKVLENDFLQQQLFFNFSFFNLVWKITFSLFRFLKAMKDFLCSDCFFFQKNLNSKIQLATFDRYFKI